MNLTIYWIVVFIFSIAALLKASDGFSDAAEKIGLHFKIPPFIIGVTLVSMGTSLPELFTSIFAVLENTPEIVLSNAIGSNITNILLILGVAAVISRKVVVHYDLIHVDLPMFIGSSFLLILMSLDRKITVYEGLLLVLGLIIYFTYAIGTERRSTHHVIKKHLKAKHTDEKLSGWVIVKLVASSILLFFGAKYAVESIIGISGQVGIHTEFVAVTAFALGTSMPELFVTFHAAKRGYSEIVVGGILGSSIFNYFGVVGIPALMGGLVIPESLFPLIIPLAVVTALLYFFMTQEKQITQWEGWLLILFYLFFIGNVLAVGLNVT